jgi:hypothetical protein
MTRATLSFRPTGPRFARPEDKLRPGPIVLQVADTPSLFRCQCVHGHYGAAEPWNPASAGMTILDGGWATSLRDNWVIPSRVGMTNHG